MKPMVIAAVVLTLALAGVAGAQQVISAKSGLINYVEGKVLLDGQPVEHKAGTMLPQIHRDSELRTEDGRAEVLLTPGGAEGPDMALGLGVILRQGENSAIRLLSSHISEPKLELLGGSILVECAELPKDVAVTIQYRATSIALARKGVYRIDGEPAALRVYDGEARVDQGGQMQSVKRGRMLLLNGIAMSERFDNKTGDALFRWSRRRAEYLALANVSAARYASPGRQLGGWTFNPYFGFYTYLPGSGFYDSFWGYRYWSPETVYMVYAPGYYGSSSNTGGGSHHAYTSVSPTSTGHSGVAAVAAPTTAANANTSTVPREPVHSSVGRK